MAADKKAKSSKKNNTPVVLAVVALLVLAAGYFGYNYYSAYFSSNTHNIDKKSYLYIRTGATYDDVLKQLKEKDFLVSVDYFDKVARQRGYDTKVKPGKYHIIKGMSNLDLVRMLIGGKQEPVRLNLNPYWFKRNLASKVGKNLEADSLRLETLLDDDAFWDKYGFNSETSMAMFLPDTYEFYWNTDAEEFIDKMAKEYKKFWTDERKAKAKKIGLSQTEVSILASIVEKENDKSDERPRIAGVYLNRLKINMPLQADPTVKFALNDYTIARLYHADLTADSPYNTYRNKGLPPGPICMPSKNAIDAVLNAEQNKYIYFCASVDKPGYHEFAVSYDEHLKNARRYSKYLEEKGIR